MKGQSKTKQAYLQLYDYDRNIIKDSSMVLCGVDEAGRGPLCGPVCCAAVVLDYSFAVEGINDSKKLSEDSREKLYDQIIKNAVAYHVELVGPEVIDEINILNATMLGMKRAVDGLNMLPDKVLIDGNRLPNGVAHAECLVKGDATSACIAAASILAKVTRDRYMLELDKQYPQYGLSQHKGYGTKLHYERIAQYGIQDFYRKSFLKKLGY